ncbi:MAG: IPTL-CTERM sorting domain-containing protein [Dissulfurispiraceae bacterium]
MGRKVFSIVFFCLVIFFTSSLAYAAIYVANNSSNTVTVYPIGSSTSTASYTISGLNNPAFVALDPTPPSTSVPTMTEWGMITFAVLAGLMSVYYLRRQQGLAAK